MTLLNFCGIAHPSAQRIEAQESGVATTSPQAGTPLLSQGILEMNGVFFDLTSVEGLFAYTQFETSRVVGGVTYEPFYNQGYYIVVHPTNPNPWTLLSAVCTMIQYGHEDEDLDTAERRAALLTRRLRLQCGDSILVTADLLDAVGIPYRRCSIVTGEEPTNFDDGHVTMEVYVGGKWVMIDMAADCYYTDDQGQPLGLYEIIQAGVENCTQARLAKTELGAGGHRDPIVGGSSTEVRFNTRPYLDINIATDALYRDWARRVWQMPGIVDSEDGLTYFYIPEGLEDRESYLLGLSANYRVITEAAWLAKFPLT